MDALHHVPDLGAALREARQVRVPGGRLVLAEPGEESSVLRDYVALFEQWERPQGAQDIDEDEPWSGDYVRRENTYPDLLDQLRQHFRNLGFDRPLP